MMLAVLVVCLVAFVFLLAKTDTSSSKRTNHQEKTAYSNNISQGNTTSSSSNANNNMASTVSTSQTQPSYQQIQEQQARVAQTLNTPTGVQEPVAAAPTETEQKVFAHVSDDYIRTIKNYGNRADTVPYPNYVDYVNCIYCHQSVNSANAYFLTNGMKVHKDCYNKCLQSREAVERDIIGKAHAFWDGYPPDWETRKAGVLREAGYKCEECGKSEVQLTVHHIVPLTKGGSNAFDNLKALCSQCHTKAHGGRDLSQNFDTTPDYIKQTVQQALAGRRNLRITYVDYYGRKTERTVKPQRIVNRQSRYILEAYCYMRKANREFRLEHIQKAEVL